MKELISHIFLLSGSLLMFIAALGILRFPDLYTRMHASTKSTSLGIGLLLTGITIYFWSFAVLLKSIIIMVFLFLTLPVASHLIGRAGYLLDIKLWKGTITDEIKHRYNKSESMLYCTDITDPVTDDSEK